MAQRGAEMVDSHQTAPAEKLVRPSELSPYFRPFITSNARYTAR